MRPVLVVFSAMDPRGGKIGGIETHSRHLARHFPADCDLVFAGIDEAGDTVPGRPLDVTFAGRSLTFLPLAQVPAEQARRSAAGIAGSTTLKFVLGGLRHIGALRRLVAGRPASADLPRVEFAALPLAMGVPFVLTVHSDLTRIASTDSPLKRHGRLKAASEALAFRLARHVFFVNAEIHAAMAAAHPGLAGKSDVMSAPVDTQIFRPLPFPEGETFRLAYAGRFDEVKDPRLMFETVRRLGEKLGGNLEFNLIGPADPEAFAEFAAIRPLAVRHGPQPAEGVATILARSHAAIMTSVSEGMPCFLLETLAAGRAFGSIRLPSFEPLILPDLSGRLVDRAAEPAVSAEHLAEALLAIRQDILAGRYRPARIAASIESYSVRNVFARLFDLHRRITGGPEPLLQAPAITASHASR